MRPSHGLATVALLVVAFAFLPLSPFVGQVSSDLEIRGPIRIVGDSDFTAANGVRGGNGTTSDPYRIEAWSISAATSTGIEVRNTTAAFVVRDVVTHSGGWRHDGLALFNVEGATVENSTFVGNWNGIRVDGSRDVTVRGNDASANGFGIFLVGVTDASILGNEAAANRWTGILLWQSSGLSVQDNAVRANRDGITSSSASDMEVSGNTIASNTGFGAFLFDSSGIRVWGNTFEGNAVQASDDGGPQNDWDAGYALGGNSWSDHLSPDDCSGANQDVCVGPDGIGDIPYTIDADSIDRYPLVNVSGSPDLGPIASFSVGPGQGDVSTRFAVNASGSASRIGASGDIEIRWDWEGDGGWDTGWSATLNAAHWFTDPGSYSITLEVRDAAGRTNTTSRPVVVTAEPARAFWIPPEAVLGATVAVAIGLGAAHRMRFRGSPAKKRQAERTPSESPPEQSDDR